MPECCCQFSRRERRRRLYSPLVKKQGSGNKKGEGKVEKLDQDAKFGLSRVAIRRLKSASRCKTLSIRVAPVYRFLATYGKLSGTVPDLNDTQPAEIKTSSLMYGMRGRKSA